MPSEELDSKDLEILRILTSDGRIASSKIAERIGLSRPAVSERMEKLERSGVIRGATVIVDPAALGRNVTAFISARHSSSLDAKAWKAFQKVMRREDVLEVHTVAGDDCYLMKVRTDSIQSLNELVNELSSPPVGLSTRTTIVMETHCEKVGGVVLTGEVEV